MKKCFLIWNKEERFPVLWVCGLQNTTLPVNRRKFNTIVLSSRTIAHQIFSNWLHWCECITILETFHIKHKCSLVIYITTYLICIAYARIFFKVLIQTVLRMKYLHAFTYFFFALSRKQMELSHTIDVHNCITVSQLYYLHLFNR